MHVHENAKHDSANNNCLFYFFFPERFAKKTVYCQHAHGSCKRKDSFVHSINTLTFSVAGDDATGLKRWPSSSSVEPFVLLLLPPKTFKNIAPARGGLGGGADAWCLPPVSCSIARPIDLPNRVVVVEEEEELCPPPEDFFEPPLTAAWKSPM